MRAHLKNMQFSAIDIERLLQTRPADDDGEDGTDERDRKWDEPTFEEAVAEMAAVAERIDRPSLDMSPDEWRALVQAHFEDLSAADLFAEVLERAELDDRDQTNEVLALVQQIWNATPQPDRDGLSATELLRLDRILRED